RFRRGYVALFGAATSADQLYEAVSAGQRYAGVEHWLPLFHDRLETLFDYAADAAVSFDHLAEAAVEERLALIEDHYKARVEGLEALKFGAPPYMPVPPERMFFTAPEWAAVLRGRVVRQMSPFEQVDAGGARVRSIGGRAGRSFAAVRSAENLNVFEAATGHVRTLKDQGKRVIIAAFPPRPPPPAPASGWGCCSASTISATPARSTTTPRPRRCHGRRRHWPCLASSRASKRRTLPLSANRTSSVIGWCGRGGRRAGRPTSSPKPPALRSAISWCTPTMASVASMASPPSPRWRRRTTVSRSAMPAATSSICRSRTSSCCRVMAPAMVRCSSIGWAAPAGSRARRA